LFRWEHTLKISPQSLSGYCTKTFPATTSQTVVSILQSHKETSKEKNNPRRMKEIESHV
jgi:hypothetical protein